MRVDVLSIGPYWLRILISEAHDQLVGVTRCIHFAEEVLKILAEGDDREVESKLLVLFQYDNLTPLYKSYLFNFVKFLLRNRLKIVWCTLLKEARLDAKKYKKIEEKIMGLGPEMVVVVH
nr:dexh-box atp-dependent rna helicase dexh12 [Quercus suber]